MMSSLNPQPMLHSLPASSLLFNPSVEVLIEKCLHEDNCLATQSGAIVAYSGKYTGRIPKAKFIVRDEESENAIWWGNNLPMDPNQYRQLREKVSAYAALQPLIVIDTLAGADPACPAFPGAACLCFSDPALLGVADDALGVLVPLPS